MASEPTTYVDPSEIHVIAPNFKQRLSGVTSTIIQLIPVQNRLGHRVAVIGPGLPAHLPHFRFADLWKLWRKPKDGRVRVWHARRNIEMLPGLVLRDILRMPLKLVFTSASQRKHSRWTKFLVSRMDAVVATSAKTASYLSVPNTVVMHGIDEQRFRPADDKAAVKQALGLGPQQKHVGCFGRVRHQKGTDLFVDSMIELLPTRPDWVAVIAGRATTKHMDFERDLKDKVRTAGLQDRILFVGEHTNINDWYRALDLFIAPQRWEGFGLTPLEAMASGVPVIATDVGAFRELIAVGETETGLVLADISTTAMAKATSLLMDDEERRHAAGRRAIERAHATFSIEGEAQGLQRIYDRLSRAHG
ncbi:glycosyltransferase family 4 protein [Rhizobium sp. 18065]|uniref:glycosyltransferase family 4 protein n=1 Tax=Rhizobium sp. 18065 TaxID=2681411 RepID=UPI001356B779|nr:glycosyltransferase family 4 protein [Rhizobium sp. 18065]